MKSLPIGEVLKEYGYINEEQLQIALDAQKKDRSKRLGEHLIDLGFVSEQQMLEALSDKLAEPLVSLDNIDFDINAVKKIPEAMAQKYNVIGYAFNDNVLTVATSDPLNYYGLEDVRLVSGCRISVSLATKADIQIAIERYYSDVDTLNLVDDIDESTLPEVEEDLNLFDANEDDTPVVKLLNSLLIRGYNTSASDIHIEPFEEKLHVRMRIDGNLRDHAIIPKASERNLITRIKLISGMNITENRLPQDGAIKGRIDDLDLDMRVSVLPTNEGEKAVIRILDYSMSLSGLKSLDFSPENYKKVEKMLTVPNGIILVTGATGSGKSTTTYSMLQELNNEERNIITVEDPIEMNIEGVNQVQVNSDIGLTFANVLRSILRQDPNIILIGEIRDSETAQIAVRASITGHLVLSTIHTNNSLSTIERLLDMDVERYLLSSALEGIVSQKLARRLCTHCRKLRPTTPYEKKIFKSVLNKDVPEIWDTDKCEYCSNGYHGRIAIQEVLLIDEEIRDVLSNEHLKKEDLRQMVYGENHVITLLQDGLEKVLKGYTTFEEIYKLIEIEDDIDTKIVEERERENNE